MSYFPSHSQNRMRHEGDVVAAREYFMTGKNRILYHLIEQRFSWMNEYIKDTDSTVIELGCGAGLSKQFIASKNFIMTDVAAHEWVDRCIDAMNIDLPDSSVDVFICSNMIHHLYNPAKFFDQLAVKLKPGGRVLIQDIYTCSLMKLVLRIMRHEGWSDSVNVFDRNSVCNDPSDAWSANCSIPKLLFWGNDGHNNLKDSNDGGGGAFERQFPQYRMLRKTRNECFLFLLSGGVIAKTFYVPVNDRGAEFIKFIDKILVRILPSIFACGCSVVLEKKKHS